MILLDLIAVACVLCTLLPPLISALLAATHRNHERDEAMSRHPAGGNVDSHWRSNARLFGWDQ